MIKQTHHRHIIIRVLFLIITFNASAQKGDNTFEFLQLPNSARTAGLGGFNISLEDQDLSLSYHNPALLTDTLDKTLTLNYCNYLLDLNYGYTAYAKDFEKYGMFAVGAFFVDYGDWDETDIYGNTIGSFTVKEMALNLMWSHQLNERWRAGITFKPIYSVMETYQSLGLAFDLGTHYKSKDGLFTAGFVIKNAGIQVISYTKDNREDLPFEMAIGLSQRLEHAPFRLSVTYRHLQQFDIGYETESSSTDNEMESPSNINLFGRHLTFGLEFLPSENFYIMTGYNVQRRAEMTIEDNPGLTGFSWGVGMKVSKFNISYSSARYHLAGRTNFFSISTNLNRFM